VGLVAVQDHLVKPEGVTEASCRVLGSPGPLPQAPPIWLAQDKGGRRERDPNQDERPPAGRAQSPGAPALPKRWLLKADLCCWIVLTFVNTLGLGGDGLQTTQQQARFRC